MKIRAKAFAKVNLTLDICGKREDGYHEIASVMQTLSLSDTITVSLEKTGNCNSINVSCDKQDLLCGEEENICFRACGAFFAEYGLNGYTVNIDINKNIPIAAGLGGGSSDGAETLRALNTLTGVNAADSELERIAASIGADVPFFIHGGTQLARGIGDILTPLRAPDGKYVVLAKPAKSFFSGKIYALYDALDTAGNEKPATDAFLAALQSGGDFAVHTNNMLTRAVCSCEGGDTICRLKKTLSDCGAESAQMTGSGPTVYGLFTDYARAVVATAIVKRDFPDIEYCDVCSTFNG